MDNSKITDDFELLLQKKSLKTPLILYNNVLNTSAQILKPQDVIKTVYSQVKAIQKADCFGSRRSRFPGTKQASKTHFLPVNKLPVYTFNMQEGSDGNPNKFDTQCVMDTQLMNIIDGGHAINANTGMTQEFDTTFSDINDANITFFHNSEENKNSPDVLVISGGIDKSIKDTNKDSITDRSLNVTVNHENQTEIEENVGITRLYYDDSTDIIKRAHNTEISKTATEDTLTLIENETNIQEDNEKFNDIMNTFKEVDIDTKQFSQKSLSPVFNSKYLTRKLKTPPPLIVSLESFENFETYAMSLIEETDFATAKHLIQSQIIGKELCLNDEVEILERDSPILDFKSEELTIKSKNFMSTINKIDEIVVDLQDTKRCDVLKDEILFSSDEEDFANDNSDLMEINDVKNDIACKDKNLAHGVIKDLPLPPTCTLKSSKDETSILERNMFVGFHTASNKSIQVCTESFRKAQSIYGDVDDKAVEEFSLTELVNKCVKIKPHTDSNITTNIIEKNVIAPKLNSDGVKDKPEKNKYDTDSHTREHSEERVYKNFKELNFSGFLTASHKKINISNKVLEKCCSVFKDIDLNENFNGVKLTSNLKKSEKNEDNVDKLNIDDNINDEMLLQEFENIEMSLESNEDDQIDIVPGEFKTVRNINIEVCNKALEKTTKSFQCLDVKLEENKNLKDIGKDRTINIQNPKQQSTSNATFMGFKTANNKEIIISDAQLAKSKDVFKDIGKDKHIIETVDALYSHPSTSKKFVGFKTANNKDIKVSNEAFCKSKDIFKDVDKLESNSKALADYYKPSTSKTIFVGFKSANNYIKEFDQGLSKYKVVDKQEPNYLELIANRNELLSRETKIPGFNTVNNKNITITNETISKTKNIIDLTKEKSIIRTSTSKEVFVGFKTASNSFSKNIKVSEEALSKTKYIFKDIDEPQTNLDTSADANHPSACKTAELRNINDKNESKDDLPESKKVFVKDDEQIFVQCDFNELEPIFRGFETVSDKQDKISDQANDISRKLLSDVMNDENINITEQNTTDKSLAIGFVGFKPANNKAVDYPTEELEKSSNMFSCLDSVDFKDRPCVETFKGFQTGSRKPISISAEAIIKSKKIFQNIDKSDSISEIDPKEAETGFKGFQTANEKPVLISEESLAETKILFQSVNGTNDRILERNQVEAKIEFERFQTPKNKSVQAIGKNKKVFQNTNEKAPETNPEETNNNQSERFKSLFVRFKTANNKNVNISEEALDKCKKIFDGIEDLPINGDLRSKFEFKKSNFKGFQTVNKKNVEISEEAIEKTKSLLSNIDDFFKKDSGNVFLGFQTASNNKVEVSEQALAKSRHIFDALNIEKDFDSPKIMNIVNTTEKSKSNNCFESKAGTNKNINISGDALAKSKKLLANENELMKKTPKDTTEDSRLLEANKDESIEELLDTQIINNFDENLCTEDFRSQPRPDKRSGSPILSCPKAKKRKKFETPYNNKPKTVTHSHRNKATDKPKNVLTFKEHYKKNKIKYSLKDLAESERSKSVENNTDPYIINFNLENMLNFEFQGDRNDINKGKIVIEDIKQMFTEATDKKLIPDGWLDIQLKLILWKLISYEIRFPNTLGKVCTATNVIDQLKYRYDKELYNAERPVLRKILEKDDVPSKTLVLCVAGIIVDGVSVVSATNLHNVELMLTDGWYFIKATIDNMLSKLVYDGKIVVGNKIVTCGAELVNCEQGIAPWEDTSAVRLSIFGNSTRPANWSDKLGLRPTAMLLRLGTVQVGGGKVSRIRVKVVRVYPRLYVEKFADGSTVTRSERLEHQYQNKYEAERDAMIEKIYEEIEKEMSDQESQDSEGLSDTGNKRKCYESGSQIAKMMKTSKDPVEFRSKLTSSQIHQLQEHVSKQRDRHVQAIQDRVRERVRDRNVLQLVRGRIVDVERDGNRVVIVKGMLSIWKPNDEVLDIFKEGSWIEATNLVPTALRNSETQLSAGRQSLFRPLKCKEEDTLKPYLAPLSRTCYNIKDLSNNPSMATEYNEIDTVGFIFLIDPSNRQFESNNQFQNVYLADINKNILCVNFWGGIKKFGYENVLDTGQVIYCGNLQKRAGNSRKNIPQYRATEFSMFTNTPRNEKGREMIEEICKKMFGLDRRKFCNDCVILQQNHSVKKTCNVNDRVTPYRFNKSDYNLAKNKMFIDTPVGVKAKNKQEDFNLTGLDFESTFRQQDTQELSPKTLQRKKKVNEKIAKLKMYGEPPPLSHIHLLNKSKNAASSYKSPLLKNASANSDIVSSKNKLEDIATPIKLPGDSGNLINSPVLAMNRTYVKRSGINPVKLNFSENAPNVDKSVDHFAEEFEGSPPLSLE